MTVNARITEEHKVHTIRKEVNYSTPGIATSVSMGAAIPTGAVVLGFDVIIRTAFNAGTTNVLNVGKTGTLDYFVDTDDINEAATGITTDILTGAGYQSADVEPLIRYTQTGTAATAGVAVVICRYIPDNDR